jgi:hypothetical protein
MKKAVFIITLMLAVSFIVGQNFRKEPYLFFKNKVDQITGDVLPQLDKIIIKWQLQPNSTYISKFRYSTVPNLGNYVIAYNDQDGIRYYELDLEDDLNPSTMYYYSVQLTDDTEEELSGSFFTPPTYSATSLTFYAYSDTQNSGNGQPPSEFHETICGKILNEINSTSENQTLILHCGDWNHGNVDISWDENYFNTDQPNKLEMLSKLPVMGIYGNHDQFPVNGTSVLEKYWSYSFVEPIPHPLNRWYSFDYGPIHVSCLDLYYENIPVLLEQEEWLISDLEETDKEWKIILFHSPIYSSAPQNGGGHLSNLIARPVIKSICEEYGVQLTLSGHNHHYAHWSINGVHYLTIGGCADDLYPVDLDQGEISAAPIHHFAKFSILNDLLTVDIIDNNGNLFESFTTPKSLNICNNENVLWNKELANIGDVRICSGSTLTITNTVSFVSNAKIIVERGAKLVLNGGILTCNEGMWQGIEVWGTASAYQNPVDQGWVQIINDGTIENAVCGIRAVKMDNSIPPPGGDDLPNYTYTGGIIQASDAHFINNQTAVQFYNYSHNSVSYFVNSEFKVDENYFGTTEPENYMVVDNMTGVRVTFCEFLNEKTEEAEYTGILSQNSTIYVEGDCIAGSPCTAWDNGTFENLEYGIYATASTTTRHIDVCHTDFENNFRGIYVGGMTSPRITSNKFLLNLFAYEEGSGLYLDRSTGYWVEDNIFEKTPGVGGTHPRGIGIVVNESGRNPNQIYLNVFNRVENAINVQGKNRHGKIASQGLVLKCNDYNHETNFDETIIWNSPVGSSEAGIAREQGKSGSTDIKDMAGNLFYVPSEIPDGDFDDINNTSNRVDYYYSTNATGYNVEPMDAQFLVTVWKYGIPTPVQWTYETACLSNINPGGGGGTGIEEDKAYMDDAREGIETTQAVLTALIDGGDTEALNTEVETSTPPEALQVYNELMSESPNLSETVVESSIEKENVLPNAMIRDVMVANPHTSKSLVLLEKLDERFDPMPEYMKAQILAGQNIQTLKEELEAELGGYQLKKAIAMENIIRYYQEQLEPQPASDSIVALYQADNTLNSSYRLAWLYLERGEYQNGESVLDNIPAQYTLDEEEQMEYNEISAIYDMLAGLYENGNTIDSLTGNQISELQTLEAEGTLTAQAYARNILMALDEIEYEEPVLFPDFTKSSKAIEEYEKLINTKPPQMLEVYPNPSSGYVIIGYNLETEVDCSIEIKDVTGKAIQTLATNGKQDQITVVTENWIPGVYIATLFIDGKSIESSKFTLVK